MIDITACLKMLLTFDNVTNSAQLEISWNFSFLLAPTLSKTYELVRSLWLLVSQIHYWIRMAFNNRIAFEYKICSQYIFVQFTKFFLPYIDKPLYN